MPGGGGHARGVAVETVESIEAVADQCGVLLDECVGRQLRSFAGAAHLLSQHDGVEAADHREHGSTTDHTRGKRLANMPGHLRFARERAVARQFRLLVILARELAIGGDACDELAGLCRRPGALEQMLPELLVVTAAELSGEQPQVRAALQMPLVQERHRFRVLRRLVEQALRSVVEVDEMRGYGEFGSRTQRHQFGRIVAERVVRGMAGRGRLAVGSPDGIGVDGERHACGAVRQQRDQRTEGARPLDEYDGRAPFADEPHQLQRTGGAVVAYRKDHQILGYEACAQRSQRLAVKPRRLVHRLSSRRASHICCHGA